MPEPRPPGSAPALAVDRLTVRLDAARPPALEGVSFEARAGEVLVVLGPNGAGKSTLLRAVAGLARSAGAVSLAGAPLASLPPRARARQVTYLPQRTELVPSLTVDAVVLQGRYAHAAGLAGPGPADRAAARAALARCDLAGFERRRFGALSQGEQRRVLVARALATEAPLLLLDEPTAALDVRHVLELYALLRALAGEGRAVVVALHALEDAAHLGDRALLLDRGRLVAAGAPSDVLTPERTEAVFRVRARPGAGPRWELPEPREGRR